MLKRAIRTTVAAGESVVLTPRRAPFSLSVVPGDGGSATAAVTASDPTDPAATWHDLAEAAATEATLYAFPSPVTGVRVSATDAAATVELVA